MVKLQVASAANNPGLALIHGYDDLRARLSVLWGRDAPAQGDNEAAAGQWREALEMASQVSEMEALACEGRVGAPIVGEEFERITGG